MDPATGEMEQMEIGTFWQYWDIGGRRAFRIRE